MDIKQMPVNKGYSHIVVLLCEVTNYIVALPLMSTRNPPYSGSISKRIFSLLWATDTHGM